MNILIKNIFFAFLFFSKSFLFAHDYQISSLRLNIFRNEAILEFNLSQYGIEQALVKKYPSLDLKTITSKEFKEILIKYIKETVFLSANGQSLKIGSGIIRLQSHQSDLKFKVINLPETIKYLDVNAHCFEENKKQQNFFTIIKNELNARVKLTKENSFTSRFTFSENEISVIENIEQKRIRKTSLIWPALLLITTLLTTVFVVKKSNLKLE